MKKLLFIDHAQALGGAEQSLLTILDRIDQTKWQIYLGTRAGDLSRAASDLGVSVFEFNFPRLRGSYTAIDDVFRDSRILTEFVKANQIDIIYANTVRGAIYASLSARRTDRLFVWHMREFWLSENAPAIWKIDHAIKTWIGKPADLILANSYALAKTLPFQEKIRVVHNGINTALFDPNLKFDHSILGSGISENTAVIGTIGRLRPLKGIDRFIRIASQLSKTNLDVRFLVVGGSPFKVNDHYAATLPALAAELGIGDRIFFTGQIQDVRPALAAMDIFVNAGDPETFGLVNIEAMAMGKPVVAFAHGALPEIVVDGETGILVPSGDEEGLYAAILKVLALPDRGKRMGENGRSHVETNFTAARMVSEISENLVLLTSS